MNTRGIVLAAAAALFAAALFLYGRPTSAQDVRSDEEAYSVIAVKDQGADVIERELTTKAKEGWTLRAGTSDFLIMSRRQSQRR